MKKEILKTVMKRIREKVPELRWVDADEGQLDFQDSRPPVAFPCCLVELSYPGAENMSAAHPGMQRVQVSLELKIGFNDCASFNVNKPLQVQETAFARLDMVEALHRAVQGFKWRTAPSHSEERGAGRKRDRTGSKSMRLYI